MEDFILQSLVYFLISFFLIHPPQEVQSAGFSIPSLFSSLLGSEESFFIHYHIVRISITIAIHSLIPLGYFLVIGFFQPELRLFEIINLNYLWKIYFSISVLIAIGLVTLVFYWYMSSFDNHPIARQLEKFSSNGQWKPIAAQINNEFRNFDKFSSGNSFYNRVYLTDNWLIKVNLYSVKFCPTSNLDVALTGAIDLNLTTDDSISRQILKLVAKPLNDSNLFEKFFFHLSSFEYQDFCDKFSLPIRQTCDIIIKQSLPEMFIDSFREQVMINQTTIYQREVFFFKFQIFLNFKFKGIRKLHWLYEKIG